MKTIYCEVIGCGRPASWLYRGCPNERREEHLCNDCYDALLTFSAEVAEKYILLSNAKQTAHRKHSDPDRQQGGETEGRSARNASSSQSR